MKITTDFGESYEAKQIKVRMVKTFVVDVRFEDLGQFGDEVSEEELEEIAHEDWLGAQAAILRVAEEHYPCIDIEFFSTDDIQLEVAE